MTKEQFDLKYRGEKVAVHCDTEEKANAFLSLAKRFWYTWIGNSDLEKTDNMWHVYKENTTYAVFDGYVVYSNKDMSKKRGYKIVEFELDEPHGYAIEDTPSPMKETFKVGDVVYDENGIKGTIEELKYLVKFDNVGLSFRKKQELTHTKPLKKITEKELADMGYVLVK